MSRPGSTELAVEIVDEICDWLIEGKSLSSCLRREDMPTRQTFLRWVRDNDWVRSRYETAREMQYYLMADDIMDIAEDGSNDYTERVVRGQEKIVLDDEHVRRSALRIETRKWIMERLAAKRYGVKAQNTLTHQNPDGSALAPTVIQIVAATPADAAAVFQIEGQVIEGEVVDTVADDDD